MHVIQVTKYLCDLFSIPESIPSANNFFFH